MSEEPIIRDPNPLETEYIPSELIDRETQQSQLSASVTGLEDSGARNLYLHGPRGTGKTHLALKTLQNTDQQLQTCYIPCTRCSTQYKALKQLLHTLTQETVNTGHHTSELKNEIEQKTGAIPTVVILDEIDFLLLNDGDDLLYYLSRTTGISTILISSQHTQLKEHVEERTYSSLYPETIQFEPYTGEHIYDILLQRAQDSLTKQSLHREALTYIASTTSNIKYALHWLKTSAEQANNVITETLAQETQENAYQNYTDELLQPLTQHHRLLYQSIKELNQEQDTIQAGDVYQRYQELSKSYDEKPLSNRRISDYLKHLELLQLIQAEYHYGGKTGKTRHIHLTRPNGSP